MNKLKRAIKEINIDEVLDDPEWMKSLEEIFLEVTPTVFNWISWSLTCGIITVISSSIENNEVLLLSYFLRTLLFLHVISYCFKFKLITTKKSTTFKIILRLISVGIGCFLGFIVSTSLMNLTEQAITKAIN